MISKYSAIASVIRHEWLVMHHFYAFDWFEHKAKTKTSYLYHFQGVSQKQMQSKFIGRKRKKIIEKVLENHKKTRGSHQIIRILQAQFEHK